MCLVKHYAQELLAKEAPCLHTYRSPTACAAAVGDEGETCTPRLSGGAELCGDIDGVMYPAALMICTLHSRALVAVFSFATGLANAISGAVEENACHESTKKWFQRHLESSYTGDESGLLVRRWRSACASCLRVSACVYTGGVPTVSH